MLVGSLRKESFNRKIARGRRTWCRSRAFGATGELGADLAPRGILHGAAGKEVDPRYLGRRHTSNASIQVPQIDVLIASAREAWPPLKDDARDFRVGQKIHDRIAGDAFTSFGIGLHESFSLSVAMSQRGRSRI